MIGGRSMSASDPLIRKLDSSSDTEDKVKLLTQVNQYLCLRSIGEGSSAKVYLGHDTQLNKPFALKRFRLKDLRRTDGLSQLEREIAAIRKMRHPNIVQLHEVLHDEALDFVYLVLDFANFGSLDEFLKRSPLQSTNGRSVIRMVFAQILSAVRYLHSQGIVHQDIKPSNILLCADGRAFLSDFGVGHSFQSTAMVVGSPGYQAPEVLSEVDDADLNPALEDVWSLGVTFYQALFGRLPFVGETVFEIVQDIRSRPLVIPDGTDPEVVKLLRGMLCPDPKKRMSVDDVAASNFFADVEITPIGPVASQDVVIGGRKIKKTTAVICDAAYSFARPCVAPEFLWRSLTPGWSCRFNEPVVGPMLAGGCFCSAKFGPFQWRRCGVIA
jgi:serine/threonine-protein kinase 11